MSELLSGFEHPIKVFGHKWEGTPIGEMADHWPTPVGAHCANCDSPILEEQSGVFIYHVDKMDHLPWHRLCFLLNILGPGLAGRFDGPELRAVPDLDD